MQRYSIAYTWLFVIFILEDTLPQESVPWHDGIGTGGKSSKSTFVDNKKQCYQFCKGLTQEGKTPNGVSYFASQRYCVCQIGQTGREVRGLGWINANINYEESAVYVPLLPKWAGSFWGFNGYTSEGPFFSYIGNFRQPNDCYYQCARTPNSHSNLPDGVNYGLGVNDGLCICIYGQVGRQFSDSYQNAVIDYEILQAPQWHTGKGVSVSRKSIRRHGREQECYKACSTIRNKHDAVADAATVDEIDANSCYCEFGQLDRAANETRYKNTLIKRSCEWRFRQPSGEIKSSSVYRAKQIDCLWRITVDEGHHIRLIFTNMQLPEKPNCTEHNLQVLNGPSASSRTVARYCETITLPVLNVPNRFATVRYFAQKRNGHVSFAIKYRQILPDKINSNREPDAMTIGMSIGAAFLFALLLIFVIRVRVKRRRKAVNGKNITTRTSDSDDNHDPWELSRTNIELGEVLGTGAFGVVYTAKLLQCKSWQSAKTLFAQNRKVAVKIVEGTANSQQQSDLLNEIELMKHLGFHDNVVAMLGCITKELLPCLVIEFMEHGSLLQCLRKERARIQSQKGSDYLEPIDQNALSLTTTDLLRIAWQISRGMEYIAFKNIVHRDLAARNVLLGPNQSCKIADFGLSRFLDAENTYGTKDCHKLPIKWMPIEAIIIRIFSELSDVWSFGVVLFELVTLGGAPYSAMTALETVNFLKSGGRMERPENCSEEIYSLMLHCWQEDPKQRPCFSAVKQQLETLMSKDTPYLDFNIDFNNPYYSYPSFKSAVDFEFDLEF